MAKKPIPETRYRASRICRTLGNPTAYETLHLLKRGGRTPDQLARMLGVTIPTISEVLRSLRQLDLVRYEVKWRQRYYRIKSGAVIILMAALESLVTTIRTQKY